MKLAYFTLLVGIVNIVFSCSAADNPSAAEHPASSLTTMGFMSQKSVLLKEPIPSERLAKISNIFDKISLKEDKEQAAILLYRYGIDKGKKYLINMARKGDMNSTLILSLNQEQGYREIILKNLVEFSVLIKNGHDEIYIPWPMVMAISEWPGEDVNTALLRAYENNPDDSSFAVALSKRGYKEALPLIESSYRSLKERSNATDDSLLTALSIIKLDGKESQLLLERYSRELLSVKTSSDLRLKISRGIFFTQDDKFVDTMRSFVEQINLRLPDVQKGIPGNNTVSAIDVASLSYAIRFLMEINTNEDRVIITSVLPLLSNSLRNEVLKKELFSDSLKYASNAEMKSLITSFFGKQMVDEQEALLKLKIVPRYSLEINETLYDSIK